MARIRHSRPDFGLGFQGNPLQMFQVSRHELISGSQVDLRSVSAETRLVCVFSLSLSLSLSLALSLAGV